MDSLEEKFGYIADLPDEIREALHVACEKTSLHCTKSGTCIEVSSVSRKAFKSSVIYPCPSI